MSAGREHYERRIAQQRAADKRPVKRKDDYDWKRDESGPPSDPREAGQPA